MPNVNGNFYSDSTYPARDGFTVSPSDSGTISARALYVGGAGDVKVNTAGGTTLTFSAVPAGTVLPVQISRVWEADTTATLMVGLV